MTNPYTSFFAPSNFEQLTPEQKENLIARFQNISAQQQFQNQGENQSFQLGQQASQVFSNPSSAMNPSAMAAMLRNKPVEGAPSLWDNASAFMNSKFGRDALQPDSPLASSAAQSFYGNTYNPLSGWSS